MTFHIQGRIPSRYHRIPLRNERRVVHPLRRDVGPMRLHRRIEIPEVDPLTIHTNARLPPAPVEHRPRKAGAAPAAAERVVPVFDVVAFPKVADPVVSFVPVNMVQHGAGPDPVDVQPRKSVREVVPEIHANRDVPVACYAPTSAAEMVPAASNLSPKNPRIWVVVEKLTQALRGKIVGSHFAVLSHCGQKPARSSVVAGFVHSKSAWLEEHKFDTRFVHGAD